MKSLTKWLNNIVKRNLIYVALVLPMASFGQHITIKQAYDLAKENYPLIRQKELIRETTQLSIQNLNKGYLPQVNISGQASYQSDVTQVDIPVQGLKIDPQSKDQYKLVADISQLIYDGGVIHEQKELQRISAKVEHQQLEVELYKLKERINQVYLSVLHLDEQIKQVDLIKQDIQTGIKRVEAQVQNGVAFKSNLNVLKAELLKADQRQVELRAIRKGLLGTLSLYLNQTLTENTVLEKPSEVAIESVDITRPEIKLFNDQSLLVEQQRSLIKTRNLPKVSLFIQSGYGRPGLNLLKNEFEPFAIGGIRFNWSLGNLYTSKKESRIIDLNRKMIDHQRETFVLNTNTQLQQQQAEIEKLNKLVESDKEIITLRGSVKEAARAQLENGVITANDYLREVNAEDQARQALITHQLQLLQAQINYQTILGK